MLSFFNAGDFDVPSSREDVDRDSSWNQWLRNEIHTLFIEALEVFKVNIFHVKLILMRGNIARWLEHLTVMLKVAASNPAQTIT